MTHGYRKSNTREIRILDKEQILTDISQTNKLMQELKQEPTTGGRFMFKEFLHVHMQAMRLKKFFRQP